MSLSPSHLDMLQPSPRSPSLGASTRRGATRAGQLRLACNQCCASKVKCSGERSGCQRCISHGSECEYQLSKVGRVRGNRAKSQRAEQNRAQNNDNPSTANSPTASTVASSVTITSLASADGENLGQWSHGSVSNPPASDDFLLHTETTMNNNLDFPPDLDADSLYGQFLAPSPAPPSLSQAPAPPSVSQAPAPPSLYHAPAHLSLYQAPQTPVTQVSNPTPLQPQEMSESSLVLACARLAIHLEEYVMGNVTSFRLVIAPVQGALERVRRLSATLQASSNMRCTLHLMTIMHQIVRMLEISYALLCKETNSQHDGSSDWQTSSRSLPLGLGQLDNEAEENRWKCRSLVQEIRQANEALRNLEALESMKRYGSEPGRIVSREVGSADLEDRLYTIGNLSRRIAHRLELLSFGPP